MILLFKRRSIADGDSTIRTTVVDVARKIAWPSSFTARVMKNRLVQDWHGRAAELAKPEVIGREMQRYMSAMQSGGPDNTGVWLGEATGLERFPFELNRETLSIPLFVAFSTANRCPLRRKML